MNEQGNSKSAWSPLFHPVFRALWIACLFTNIGAWMQNVGGVWLMTTLTTSPLLIALMQTATTLPVFLVVLPAGALADIVDRRRMLLLTQGWIFCAACGLSVLTYFSTIPPWALLAFTFAIGLGSAMNLPAWQVVLPGLVTGKELPSAVALNGVSINISRAVGPALAGLIIAYSGPPAVFLLNALSFLGVMMVVYRWKMTEQKSALPPEHIMGAIRAGTRYVINSPDLRSVLFRCSVFVVFSSALLALAPVMARQELGMESTGFGALLGSLGIGGLVGAVSLPRLRRRLSFNGILIMGSIIVAISTLGLALIRNEGIIYVLMATAGFAWLTVMVGMNVSTQNSSPAWVRARAMGFYTLAYQGGMAVAGALWGTLSSYTSTPTALIVAGVGMCMLPVAFMRRREFSHDPEHDFMPAVRSDKPRVSTDLGLDDGPVLVIREYLIDIKKAPAFTEVMYDLGRIRRRDGAMKWRLYHDVSEKERYLELFVIESWAEHLRQHSRMTVVDQVIMEKAFSFHVGDGPPKVTRLLHAPNDKTTNLPSVEPKTEKDTSFHNHHPLPSASNG